MINIGTRSYNCPVELTIELVGGKWKPRIITFLNDRRLRFGELARLLPDTSRKVLVEQLRQLEADRIVTRTVHAEVPPRVEYALTPEGLTLLPIFAELRRWGAGQSILLQADAAQTEGKA